MWRLFHWHTWFTIQDKGWGHFLKKRSDGMAERIVVRGRLESCACGVTRIVPFNKDLKPTVLSGRDPQ